MITFLEEKYSRNEGGTNKVVSTERRSVPSLSLVYIQYKCFLILILFVYRCHLLKLEFT